MRSILQAVAAVGAMIFCIGAAAPSRIDYELTPILQDGALQAVQIDLTFRGERDGSSDLRLPDSWGGQDELWRSVEALEVVSGATMRDGEEPNQRVPPHRQRCARYPRRRGPQRAGALTRTRSAAWMDLRVGPFVPSSHA
ncbi:MAG: hypothetical protein ABL932_23895 [Terricaulis sp.]